MNLNDHNIRNDTEWSLSTDEEILLKLLGIDTGTISKNKINEVTFFVCLKHLAESMAKLPIKQYSISQQKGKEIIHDNHLDRLLNIEPNCYMNATTFWQAVENNRNYYGNAYVYIERQNVQVKYLPYGCYHLMKLKSTSMMQVL